MLLLDRYGFGIYVAGGLSGYTANAFLREMIISMGMGGMGGLLSDTSDELGDST